MKMASDCGQPGAGPPESLPCKAGIAAGAQVHRRPSRPIHLTPVPIGDSFGKPANPRVVVITPEAVARIVEDVSFVGDVACVQAPAQQPLDFMTSVNPFRVWEPQSLHYQNVDETT